MHRPDHVIVADEMQRRCYLAIGTMIGFLSHLVLDELFAVDSDGRRAEAEPVRGECMKLKSDSWIRDDLDVRDPRHARLSRVDVDGIGGMGTDVDADDHAAQEVE